MFEHDERIIDSPWLLTKNFVKSSFDLLFCFSCENEKKNDILSDNSRQSFSPFVQLRIFRKQYFAKKRDAQREQYSYIYTMHHTVIYGTTHEEKSILLPRNLHVYPYICVCVCVKIW